MKHIFKIQYNITSRCYGFAAVRKDKNMKKHLILILTLMLTVLAVFSSCAIDKGDGGDQTDISAITDYIFKPGSSLTFLLSTAEAADTNTDRERYNDLADLIFTELSVNDAELMISYADDTAAKVKREIMLGRCDRELSRQAYRELDKIKNETGESKYVIYSNGASVAIAYPDGDYDAAEIAARHFVDTYVIGKTYLTLKAGFEDSKAINMSEYYKAKAEEQIAAEWKSLEESMTADYLAHYSDSAKATKLVSETIEALRIFYRSFDNEKLVRWFANLYEPDICVCNALYGATVCERTSYCGGAGFYFSNGGRDTAGFMPDLESTSQVFGFLKNSGMLDSVGGDISKAFPAGEAEKMVMWVQAMQSPENNGYFYHPQWSVQESNANIARIGRDLSHAVNILKTFGASPIYQTPSGVGGDGDSTLPVSSLVSSSDKLTFRLAASSAAQAVSRVVSVADSSTPSHMLTESAWRKYLAGLNIRTNSYLVANEISSSSSAILARDKELAAMNADYRLTDILMDWFAENQNPNTGTWHWGSTDDPYYANNGVLKIITTYQSLGREFPNPLPAIDNAINALTCATPINHVCDLYNTWFTISFICNNLRTYGNSGAAAEVVWALREKAPEAIKATATKMAACRCEDGSFSYHPGVSSTSAQGLPVSPPGIEGDKINGDVNATVICTYGNINYMFGALNLYGAPSICTDADRFTFKNIISELGRVIKREEIDPYSPDTFDDFTAGNAAGYKFMTTVGDVGSHLSVVTDKREGAEGNVMQMHSGIGSWDRFIIPTKTGLGGDAFIFETDICFDRALYMKDGNLCDVSDGSLMTLVLGSGESATAGFYALNAQMKNGEIFLYDMSSSKDGAPSSQYTELARGFKPKEWFYIRLEHYKIDDATIRVKVYVGETRDTAELVAVSDNFFDYYANKIDNPKANPPAISVYATSMLSVSTDIEQDILFDNLCIYKSRKAYEEEMIPLNKNVDGPEAEEIKYNFAELETLPEEIRLLSAEGTANLSGGYLNLNGATLEIDANFRERAANVASLSSDVLWNGGSSGDNLLSVLFTEGEIRRYNVFGIDFKVKNISGQDYLVLYQRKGDGTPGSANELVKITKGVATNISIDFYHTENVALVYVDGEFIIAVDAVYNDTRPRLIDMVEISAPDGAVSLNSIIFERRKFDFAVAVEPETESDVHGFDSVSDEEASGAEFKNATVSGGKANLSLIGSSVTLPLSVRTPIVSSHLVEFTIIPGEYTSGKTVRPAILDADGNIIMAVDVSVTPTTDGIKVEVYETGKGGGYDLVIGSKIVGHGEDIVITLLWFPDDLAANVEICGETVGTTSVCYDVGVSANTPEYGTVYSISNAAFAIDNMIAESLYKYRTPITLDGTNKENGAEKLTYDYSSSSNLPKALTMSLKSGGSAVRIEQAFKEIAEKAEYSKALVIDSRSGSNDEFKFAPSNTTAGANRVVFETEMMVSSKSSKTTALFQIMFTDTSNSTRDITYMPVIGIIDDKVVLTDMSSTGKDPANEDFRYENKYFIIGNVDEWFKLRIEYFQGTKDTVRIAITVNGNDNIDIIERTSEGYNIVNSVRQIVSDNYYGYRSGTNNKAVPLNNIKQVLFYGQSGPNGLIYMDNTVFFGDGSTFSGEVNLNKTLK